MYAYQANEMLWVFKETQQCRKMVEMLMPRILDRHGRFMIMSHFKSELQTMLTSMHNTMGQAMNFNFYNPQGHYKLNLSVPEQREVANVLILLNKLFFAKVKAGEYRDRS